MKSVLYGVLLPLMCCAVALGAMEFPHYPESINAVRYTDRCPDQVNVFVAPPPYTVAVGFRALIFKPSTTNLSYAVEAVPLPAPSPHWNIFAVHPGYHFGFDLDLHIVCPANGLSALVRWEHFNSSSTDSHVVGTDNMVGPFFEIGPDALPYTQTQGTIDFSFNMANLTVGQYIYIGSCVESMLSIGASVARIKERVLSRFSNEEETVVRTINVPITFTGAGPYFNVDFSYTLFRELALKASLSTSVLVGRLKNNTTFQAFSPALAELGITPPNTQTVSVQTATQVVPAIEERIGFAYYLSFCNQRWLKLEAGYEAKVYFNALQSIDIGSEVITPPVTPDTVGVYARTFHRTLSNFSLSGPYVALSMEF